MIAVLLLCLSLPSQDSGFCVGDPPQPAFVVTLEGKEAPEGLHVRATLLPKILDIRLEGRIGKGGSVELKDKNEALLGWFYKVKLEAGPLPHGKDATERVWYTASGVLNTRKLPLHLDLKRQEAYLLGAGRLVDAKGKGIAGASIRIQAMEVTGGTGVADIGEEMIYSPIEKIQYENPFWMGSRKTGNKGGFELWGTHWFDTISIQFHKKKGLPLAIFALEPGAKDQVLALGVSQTLRLDVVLPQAIPLAALRARLHLEDKDGATSLPIHRFRKGKREGDLQHWRMDLAAVPMGTCELELTLRSSETLLARSQSVRIEASGFVSPQGFLRLDSTKELGKVSFQICDAEGKPVSGSIVSVNEKTNTSIMHYSVPADRDGRVSLRRWFAKSAFIAWAKDCLVTPIPEGSPGLVKLHPAPEVEFRIPESMTKPHPDLEARLALLPFDPGAVPGQCHDWWSIVLSEKRPARIRVGWSGSLGAFLVLKHKKTGQIRRLRAWHRWPLRRLDKRKKPVNLRFDAKHYRTALSELGIR